MARSGRPNKSDHRVDAMTGDIEKGQNEKVKQLLSEVGVDACDGYLRTALLWASVYNNTTLMHWLIDNGANINHQDRNGFSSLHFIAQEKRLEAAELILNKKADLNVKDINGNTPLMEAIFNSKGDYSIVKLFLKNGADLDAVNNHEVTPRELADTIEGFDLSVIGQ